MNKIITKNDLGIGQNGAFGRLLSKFAMSLMKFNSLNELISQIATDSNVDFAEQMLAKLDIFVKSAQNSDDYIPKSGGFLAVANFPHGILDCLAMLSLIGQKRKDIKFLLNAELASLPLTQGFSILGSSNSTYLQSKEAVKHVQNGGVLIIFPARVVANYSRFLMHPKEGTWSNSILKISKIAGVPIVPFYIDGRASKSYLTLSKMFPNISNLLYAREIFKHSSSNIDISVGKGLYFNDIVSISHSESYLNLLQSRIVTETVRGVTFLQSLKLNEGYSPQKDQVPVSTKISYPIELQQAAPIFSSGELKLYLVDNKIVITNGTRVLLSSKYNVHYFKTSSSMSKLTSFQDFEFNYRQFTKNVKSCVEFSEYEVDIEGLRGSIRGVEDFMKQLVKYLQVDALLLNIRYIHQQSNAVTSSFINYLDVHHCRGVLNKSVISRGVAGHTGYVGRLQRRESGNFYSAALFARYGADIDCLDIPDLLLFMLNIGAKVGSISGRSDDQDRFVRSFLVFL